MLARDFNCPMVKKEESICLSWQFQQKIAGQDLEKKIMFWNEHFSTQKFSHWILEK